MNALEVGRTIGEHAAGGAVAGTLLAALIWDGDITLSLAELAKETRSEYHATRRCLLRLETLGVIEIDNLPDKRYRIKFGLVGGPRK